MRRALLLALCLAGIVPLSAQLPLRGGMGRAVSGLLSVRILEPSITGAFDASVLAQTLSGTATAGAAALDTVTVACAGSTTIASVAATGTATWSRAITLLIDETEAPYDGVCLTAGYVLYAGDGLCHLPTTCTVTVTDVAAGTSTATLVFRVTSPDVAAPVVTIATSGGADYTVTADTATVTVNTADDVGVDTLTWCVTSGGVCTVTAGSCTGPPPAPAQQWTCPVSLLTVSQQDTANPIRYTATDASAQTGTDTHTITRDVPLEVTSSALGTCTVAEACSRTLAAIGHVGGYTWDNGSGGTSLGAGACTGLSISAGGVVSGTPTVTAGSPCAFTARVTSGAETDSASLSLAVAVAGSETAHTYFTDMIALGDATVTGYSTAHSWSLRSQGQIETLNKTTEPSIDLFYRWPSSDTYHTPQDAAKIEMPIIPCVANTGCVCTTPQTVCGGSDDPGGQEALRFNSGIQQTADSVLLTFDAYFDTTWRDYSNLKKLFGWAPAGASTGWTDGLKGGLETHCDDRGMEKVGTQCPQTGTTLVANSGNGAGLASIGAISQNYGPMKLAMPGLDGWDGLRATGEGAATHAGESIKANFHINQNVWTRYWINYAFNLPLTDASFAKWRTVRSLGAGTFALTNCIVAAGVATCTVAADWTGVKEGTTTRKWGPATLKMTIAGAGWHAGLVGIKDVTTTSSTVFTFATAAPDATYNTGTMTPHAMRVSVWIADEVRNATRIVFAAPMFNEGPTNYFGWIMGFDTSASAALRQHLMYGYVRNLVMLKNYTLDFSGTCNTAIPAGTPGTSDPGYCEADVATNVVAAWSNATLFRKPVR